MEDDLSDEDVGLLSDDEVGLGDQAPATAQASPGADLSDEDVGLLSDADVGLEEGHHAADPNRLTAGAREYAHGLAPAMGGFVAAGAGAKLGAALGLPLAPFTAGWSVPVGGVLGGIGGFVGGGLALSAIQEKAAKLFGMDDSETRRANAEEYPMSTWVGGTAAALTGMSPGAAVAVWSRLISAGALTALEGTTQYLTEGKLDPTKLAAAAAAGAIFYDPNRIGKKLLDVGGKVERFLPGAQPNPASPTPPTGAPAAAQAHVDVGDTAYAAEQARYKEAMDDPEAMRQFAFDEGITEAEAQDVVRANYGLKPTIGNPQSAATRDSGNDGRYKKGAAPGAGTKAPTEGEITPDTMAALEEWLNEGDAPKPPTPVTAADSGMLNPGENLPIDAGFPEDQKLKEHPRGEAAVEVAKQPGIQLPVGEGEGEEHAPGAGHAPAAPPHAQTENAGIPFMITAAMKQKLGLSGFTPEEISHLTPEQAQEFLSQRANNATVSAFRDKYGMAPRKTFDEIKAAEDAKAQAPKFEELKPGDTRADNPPGKGPTPEQHADLVGAPEADKYPPGAGDKALKNLQENIAELEAKQPKLKKGERKILQSLQSQLRAVQGARERIDNIVTNNERYEPAGRVIKGEPHVAPSDAQIKANNFVKGRTRFAGKEVAIETAEGGIRRSKANSPEQWEVKDFPYNYGDVKGVKGADGDDLDIALGKGNKHFIIDQRDAKTGKFDEHKVFADWKSEADALTGYRRGFSDGKGRDRMMHITEVTEPEAKQWMDNGDKSKPFRQAGRGTAGREFKQPGVVTAAVSGLREAGMHQAAEAIEALPPKKQMIEAARANAFLTNRTGKVPTDQAAERQAIGRQGVRSKPPMVEGANVSANTKPEAIRKTNELKAAEKIFEDHKFDPKRNSPETDEETIARAQAAALASRSIGRYPFLMRKKTDAVSWLKAARELGKKPTAEQLKAFRADEILARNKSGSLVQETSGIKAGIELNRNAGEERVNAADAERAKHWEDIPHEEAQDVAPEKVIKSGEDLEATKLPRATIDMTKAAGRKELAKELQGKKPTAAIEVPERFITLKDGTKVKADAPQSEVRKPTISDELKKKYAEQINAPKELKSGTAIDMYAKFIKDAAKDESGAVNIQKIKDDWKRLWRQPAAKSWRARVPKGAEEEYAASLDHQFQVLKQEDIDHKGRMMKWADSLPKELNNSESLERLYFAHEENRWGHNSVTPQEKALFDQHIKPLLDENDRIFQNLKKIAPGEVGRDVQNHMYRIVKGDDAEYNIMESGGGSSDPIEGVNALATKGKGPALNRSFVALERADGKRFVIRINPDGFTFWKNGSGRKVVDPDFKYKTGDDYQLGSQKFKMGEATTREIEANARVGDKHNKIEYFHNAAMSAGMTNAYLGSLLRHIEFLNSLKTAPKFLAFATPPGKTPKDGYIETTLKNFAGWKMDPRLAWAMNDYVQPGFNEPALNMLRRISQAITKTIFWIFTAHVNNVGTHWFTGRGMDWVPFHGGYKSLFMTSGKAIKSVITQDGFQSEMRQHGAGTIYGGVVTENFTQKFGNKLSEQIKANPAKWDPIARVFGWGPSTLAKAIYSASKHIMWAVNDMMLTQAVMERMSLHGMTMEEAINSSQRHIPPYIVPSTIISGGKWGRIMSQAVQDALLFVFGRYHFGMFTSYANMVKEIVHGTAHERFHAIGNLMMLGILGMGVYPLLDKAWQGLTGNPDAEAQRRGPTSIPHHLHRAWEGKSDPLQAARSTLTVSPLISTVLEGLNNKDFRGKQIVQPGDMRLAGRGSWRAGGRALLDEGEHAAKGLISPLGTLEQGAMKNQNPLQTLRDQALDIRNPSDAQRKREHQIARKTSQESRAAYKHPPGAIRGAWDKAVGYGP